MGIDIKVDFDDLRREDNGNVAGNVALEMYGDVFGKSFERNLESKDFSFSEGGEQEVYNKEMNFGLITLKLTAKVYLNDAGECCIQGHVHADAPIGGGIGIDLDPNCRAIPSA